MPLAATIFIKTIFSFFATVAFGKLFKCPESCLYKAGFVGMVGFGVYIVLLSGFGLSSMLSNFAGTVALSICSEIFARWYRQPVPIFSIPGIGQYYVTAVNNQDLSILMGETVILAAMYIVVLFITDLLYVAVDPRISLTGKNR